MGTPMAEASATRSTVEIEHPAATPAWRIDESADGVVFLQHERASGVQPDDWRERLANLLTRWPRTGMIGGKRIDPAGAIASAGESIIHPKGFHHIGRGATGDAYRFPFEVDAFTGGVIALRAESFPRELDLHRLMRTPLGAIELGLHLRRDDWRVAVDPGVVVVEEQLELLVPAREAEAFRERWGFDWNAPDLAAVRAQYAGTGLLWNLGVHGRATSFAKYDDRPFVHWNNYRDVAPYRQRADHIVQLIRQLLAQGRVVDLGCGDGLFTHLFAQGGLEAIGLDSEASGIKQARERTADESYPGSRPIFEVASGDALPLPDRSVHLVTMLDVIEHLDNPVAVLREAHRVLTNGGGLFITTPAWQFGASSDAVYHNFEYTADELSRQVTACGFEIKHTGRIGGAYRDLIVIARRVD